MLINLLPSEIARLVLNYLQEESLTKTYNAFLEECTNLNECKSLLDKGIQLSKTIHGKTLKEYLVTDVTKLTSTSPQLCSTTTSSSPPSYYESTKQKQSVGTQTPYFLPYVLNTPPLIHSLTQTPNNPQSAPQTPSMEVSSIMETAKYSQSAFTIPNQAYEQSVSPSPNEYSQYYNHNNGHGQNYEASFKRQRLFYNGMENDTVMRRFSASGIAHNQSSSNLKREPYEITIEDNGQNGDYNSNSNSNVSPTNRNYYLHQNQNDNSTPAPPCKCGSTEHRRITHKACPLNLVKQLTESQNNNTVASNSIFFK